jgi:Zn-dependent peptidase ImmA (M78 family)
MLGYLIYWIPDDCDGKEDAYSQVVDNHKFIYIKKRNEAPCKTLWSITHEVSHLWLGHYEQYDLRLCNRNKLSRGLILQLNREANLCTEEILMPEEFILDNYRLGTDYLRKTCCVSRKSIEIRCVRLGLVQPNNINTDNEQLETPATGSFRVL